MDLLSGTVLYDTVDKSIGILIRRYEAHSLEDNIAIDSVFPDIGVDYYVSGFWESIWSKDGRVFYSEFGLLTLIENGLIIVVCDT